MYYEGNSRLELDTVCVLYVCISVLYRVHVVCPFPLLPGIHS